MNEWAPVSVMFQPLHKFRTIRICIGYDLFFTIDVRYLTLVRLALHGSLPLAARRDSIRCTYFGAAKRSLSRVSKKSTPAGSIPLWEIQSSPGIEHAEFLRPAFDVRTIEISALHIEDPGYIAQLSL